jgi:ferredoxin
MRQTATATRDKIGVRLARRPETAVLAERLLRCRSGACGGCGDICPVRAARFYRGNQANIRRLFRGGEIQSIQRLHFSLASWSQEEGQLAEARMETIFKTLRRALNRLREPSIRAVGMVNASWGGAGWHLAANAIISGPSGIDILRAFDRAKNIIALDVRPVPDIAAEILSIFREAQSAECLSASAIGRTTIPANKLRREYYCWLSGVMPGGRVFRYGCGRYFNPLEKKLSWKPVIKKGHPSPRWLVRYQYGSHPYGCDCRICQGGRR